MKSRRGITTIVATVFLIAVVVASLTYITYSLELMANFSEQLVTEEVRKKNVQDEAFELVFVNMTDAATPTVFKLDATIQNTGEIPLKITTLWLDKQNENDVVRKIPIDLTIAPGRTFNLIDESIDIDVDSTAGYSMKFITTRGETQTFYLNSAGTESLDIEVTAIPEMVPDGFQSTLLMTVVNNMTNNRELHNLVPTEPTCELPDCTKISGPIPASYKSLKPGDVAIFRWVYEVDGQVNDSFTFTSSLVGGVPENSDSATITIGSILDALSSGQAISASGFGSQEAAPDSFVLHTETGSIPALADFQMSTSTPDTLGSTHLFPTDGNALQWFSANASGVGVHIPAGSWNASLRYESPRLPSGMDSAASSIHDSASDDGGHTFHFNTDETLARKDSGQIDTCTDLVDSGTLSGATWFADRGVNGSGAYYFDGDDYISITNSNSKKDCNYLDAVSASIAGWFNATSGGGNSQAIYSKYDTGEGGYEASLENGNVEFTVIEEGAADFVKCTTSGTDYRDNEWHHFAGVFDAGAGKCTLYVDDIIPVTHSDGVGHEHENDDDIYIGMRGGTTNGFEGYLDDIMWWNAYILTADDVAALRGYSFGENATKMNFFINNATGNGDTVDNLGTSLDYDLPWSDPFDGGVDYSWIGGNYTVSLPLVGLNQEVPNRLNFTMSYSSGEPLTLLIDESELDGLGTTLLSSYLQTPKPPDPEHLPTYLYFLNSETRVEIFVYNAGDEGAWLTYQGTRVIFNGTNGHFAGLVDTVDDGIELVYLSSDQDGPFVAAGTQAEIDFYHPKHAPDTANSVPPGDRIPTGFYDVIIYLNGYDETGGIIVRSLDMGIIEVIE